MGYADKFASKKPVDYTELASSIDGAITSHPVVSEALRNRVPPAGVNPVDFFTIEPMRAIIRIRDLALISTNPAINAPDIKPYLKEYVELLSMGLKGVYKLREEKSNPELVNQLSERVEAVLKENGLTLNAAQKQQESGGPLV